MTAKLVKVNASVGKNKNLGVSHMQEEFFRAETPIKHTWRAKVNYSTSHWSDPLMGYIRAELELGLRRLRLPGDNLGLKGEKIYTHINKGNIKLV